MRSTNSNFTEGMGWRIILTMLAFFGAVIGIVIWLFFYAGNFSVYQNIAVVVVVIIGSIAVTAATWAEWRIRQAERSQRNSSKTGTD